MLLTLIFFKLQLHLVSILAIKKCITNILVYNNTNQLSWSVGQNSDTGLTKL